MGTALIKNMMVLNCTGGIEGKHKTKRRNKDLDIIVSSLGGSTDNVTGSCWTISYPKNNGERGLIVLECGLVQDGNTIKQQYNANKRMVETVGKEVVQECEYVLLGHAHVLTP